MKYYGLKKKIQCEDLTYAYAKTRTKVLSILPGKHKKFWKQNFELCFKERDIIKDYNNSLPEGKFLKLDQIVTADLIYREDIKKLQKGIRRLLKERRSSRFLGLPIEGLDEICSRLEKMDSALLSWYEEVRCGIFEFKGLSLESSIDHFVLSIKNMNSSYLELEFCIHLTDQKQQELYEIINSNYREERGYAHSSLTSRSNSGGAFESYTVVHFNNDYLKADKIYEFISYIEWEFYEELKSFFPFMLHRRGIMPPRIEIYYTDIDYRENHKGFWHSIGISDYQGQFLDDRQKVFFNCGLSGRYERYQPDNRLLYIIKDDGIELGQLESVKDDVYFHIQEYAIEYFRFLFLQILSKETGKLVVSYKHRLDKIKLHRNRLKGLLKLKYAFSRDVDYYSRYIRDDNWEESIKKLEDTYSDSDELMKKITKPVYPSYKNFCNGALRSSKETYQNTNILLSEFENKGNILQNLSDYRNTARSMKLNAVMLFIAAVTLFFVIFPERVESVANIFRALYHLIFNIFQ